MEQPANQSGLAVVHAPRSCKSEQFFGEVLLEKQRKIIL
jgi:hypothetical protein